MAKDDEKTSKAEKVDKADKAEEKVDPRQKQADHFAEVMSDMQAVVADPASTPEEVAEANKTIENMTDNLKRLNNRFTITPTSI